MPDGRAAMTPETLAALAALSAASRALSEHIGYPAWRVAIGIRTPPAEPALIVYATNRRSAERMVPTSIHGFPVIVKRSGKLRPAAEGEG